MPHQRLEILFEKCINSVASPEEHKELMDLILLRENETLLRKLISESMLNENELSLSATTSEAIVKNIFDEGKKTELKNTYIRKRRLLSATYSIAALFILLIGAAYYFDVFNTQKNNIPVSTIAKNIAPVQHDVLPGSTHAYLKLGNGRNVPLDSSTYGALIPQQGVTLLNNNGILTYEKKVAPDEVTEFNTVVVPEKGQYQLVLSDGTQVWLNAASSLRFPTVFNGKERIVELFGEGYFEVAKDPERPFHVKAGKTDIQALGTHFNVMAYFNEGSLQTTLLEGSVKVTLGNNSCVLNPGQEAYVYQSSMHINVEAADVDEVIAWKNGYFLFNGKTPLSSVMHKLERWYGIDVNYQEGVLPNQNFGGGIQRSLPLSGVLSVLEESGIRFKVDHNIVTVLK